MLMPSRRLASSMNRPRWAPSSMTPLKPSDPRHSALMTGLYVHIPFCEKKCRYCNFPSIPRTEWDDAFCESYVEALLSEIESAAQAAGEELAVDSIFFGGGTPSLLPLRFLREITARLRHCFHEAESCELSIEANPGTIDAGTLKALRFCGFNRLSIGAQSLRDDRLAALGRIHGRREIFEARDGAVKAGFPSIGMDLIYGIPGQGLAEWERDLDEVLSLGLHHLSAYGLTPEEGTPLGDAIIRGLAEVPGDDEQAMMMEAAHERLTSCGYVHYEVSNFALAGHECRHNMRYWLGGDYLGFGSSACSFMNRWRFSNTSDPREYVRRIEEGLSPIVFAERLSLGRQMGEYMMMALRTEKGAGREDFMERFGVDPLEHYRRELDDLAAGGLVIVESSGTIRIPPRHFFLQSEIASRFIEES
ncbi:MAG: radical SAM family heme chaperone HemW [Candidatus Eremiobacteraeota bacterium]|nr:radical SAM family heme chaperone HemW [Candidatus Eremiobacteraeota bacterium]